MAANAMARLLNPDKNVKPKPDESDLASVVVSYGADMQVPDPGRMHIAGKAVCFQCGRSAEITGGKDYELKIKRAFTAMCGCNFDELDIQPVSFDLEHPTECDRFVQFSKNNPGLSYIVKGSHANQGSDIQLHLASSSPLTEELVHARYCKSARIAQQYIDNALLLSSVYLPKQRFKFDFRVWALMARADPHVVYYRDGHVRRAVLPLGESFLSHVTNGHLASGILDSGNVTGHERYWSFLDLSRWLEKNYEADTGKKLPPEYVGRVMRPYIKQVLRFVFLSATADTGVVENTLHRKQFSLNTSYLPGTSNIYAFDFVMDDDLNVVYLEGNDAPGMPGFLAKGVGSMKDTMMGGALELILKVQTESWDRSSPQLQYKGWELIYNEAHEMCLEETYNACKIFSGKTQAEVAAGWPYSVGLPSFPESGAPFEAACHGDNGYPWYQGSHGLPGDRDRILRDRYGITDKLVC